MPNYPLSKGFIRWFQKKRSEMGLNQAAFIRLAEYDYKISGRQLKRIEANKGNSVQEPTVNGLADLLEIDPQELKKLMHEFKDLEDGIIDFTKFLEQSITFDELLLSTIRLLEKSTSTADRIKLYDAAVHKHLSDVGLGNKRITKILESPEVQERLINDLPDSSYKIKIDEGFNNLTHVYNGDSVTIKNPKLLWECTCYEESGKENCPLHNESVRTHFTLNNNHVEIIWRGNSFRWYKTPGLWPPSIDSFQMILTLEKEGVLNDQSYETMLDLGAGTGFLGICIASMLPSLRSLTLSDWTFTSLIFSTINFKRCFTQGEIASSLSLGINGNQESLSNVNLLICNPPYLPVDYKFQELAKNSTVMGTELLESVIRNARNFDGDIYMQFSNIALKEAERVAQDQNCELEPVGGSHEYPFRVSHVADSEEYLKWLVNDHGLRKGKNELFDYYHKIQLFKVK